jgi:rod shape-determining protein MreD
MRWLSFGILAYVTISLQIGLNGMLDWGGAAPNLVLPVVVFVAVNAAREEALIGTFLLGVLQDLFTVQPMGLYAFAYGMLGLFVVGAQPSLYRDHPLTHFVLTLAGALVTGVIVLFNEWTYPILHQLKDAPRPAVGRVLGGAVYTAAIAPVMLMGLSRVKRLFAFRGGKTNYSRVMARA